VLHAALHGSSSSGNLNLVSVIKTSDRERKAHLQTLHFGQPMVGEAPLVLSFCADSFRTRQWLAQRDARLGFADFISWHVAGYDAIILAQTAALAFESHGLGICYMGTTLHSMGAIAEYLELPPNCLPVTSLVVGWPAEAPAQRDRLPARAWIHDERYQRPSAAAIDSNFGEREVRGWQRYREMGPEMTERMAQHGIPRWPSSIPARSSTTPIVSPRIRPRSKRCCASAAFCMKPDRDTLRALLQSARTIAVVGLSADPLRPSHGVAAYLQSAGYRIVPVNPLFDGAAVLGEPSFARLEDVPGPIDIVDVFRRSADVPPIASAAVAVRARCLWQQQGIHSAEADRIARAGGLLSVSDSCLAVEHARLGI
jgi:predicted CoA-binding protein/nitroreductase